jgi:hypothetical protein
MTSEINQRRGIPPHVTVIEYGADGKIVGGRWIIEKPTCVVPPVEPPQVTIEPAARTSFHHKPKCFGR